MPSPPSTASAPRAKSAPQKAMEKMGLVRDIDLALHLPLRYEDETRLVTIQEGLKELKGEGGWTEVAGCPVFTNDDGAKGVQAMTDILAANPDLVGFGIMGGWPLFGAPQPYRDLFKPMADKIAKNEFVIGAADTIGDEVAIAKEGLVTALVGQRPFEMGYKAPTVMIDLITGKAVADPVFTGLDECTKDTTDTCIQK
ncbi:MAG: substrate-binding domain-containing protein [Rhizobacter sp.]